MIMYFKILSTDRFSEAMSRQQMLEFKTQHETFTPPTVQAFAVLQSLEIQQSLKVCYMSNIKPCFLYFYHHSTYVSLPTISLLSQT
jgi:hypothetical protein